jgi:hypothetical protein
LLQADGPIVFSAITFFGHNVTELFQCQGLTFENVDCIGVVRVDLCQSGFGFRGGSHLYFAIASDDNTIL